MKKKLWVILLALVLIVAMPLLSGKTLAADDDPGVYVDKKVTVQEDGTYVIDLDAYATGTVTTTTVVKPCDLVLVLDASSSMGQTGSSYLMADGSLRIQALVDAVNAFLATVAEKNAENAAAGSALSRVAIVVFSDSSNTGTLYGFTEITNANLASYSVYSRYNNTNYTTTGYGTSGKRFDLHNYTWTDSGLSKANDLLVDLTTSTDANPYDMNARNRVVVMFTDGYPNHGGGLDNFDTEAARNVITTAATIKSARQASLFTIAVLGNVAQPGYDPQNTNQTTYGGQNQMRLNQMLHAASSNYPLASVTSTWNVSWGSGGNYQAGYYKSATKAEDLKNIFTDIAEHSASTQTPLTSESVMKDIVSSSFTLPKGANVNTIEVTIVPWDSTNHTWSTTGYTPTQWATQCTNYGATTAENVSVNLSTDGKTIDVTGFDYGTHFLATSNPTQDVDNVNKNSAKVHIKFPIQAKPSAITGSEQTTNDPESGIYIDGNATEPLIAFPQPTVVFRPVTYVVDYVTSDTTHDTKSSSIKLDYKGVLKNVQMLDDPSDDYLIGEKKVDFDYTIYKGKYGTISFGDDEFDVQRRYVRYAPTTMDWHDYDRIFIKGESATDDEKDVWAMLCVLPANSVFYEDTYITQTKTVTYNGQQVEIEYTGINYDSSWSTVGTEGSNQTYHAGDDMGWISGLSDDSSFANDMAHMANTAKAKATFTVSGTGIDIYSRTNGSTGTISVTVKSAAEDNLSGKKVTKTKIIDTKAAAGDFFAIPVCTFTDLSYGKYTVTITVTAGAQKEGRMIFYLDGVRVYNPIQPHEDDGNVAQMYGEKNMGAVFTEVRSLLGTGATAEALYIDEFTTSEIVTNLDAINAAAVALAEAQQNRDNYVNGTITPAKNALTNAQYAVPEAETALDNAIDAYTLAEEAYNAALEAAGGDTEDPTVVAAKAVLDEKLADKNAAQTAYDAAVATYTEEYIAQLEDDLDEAIAGKAEYDAKVDAAIKAYDIANDGVTVAYKQAEIAEYLKEGPKSEVLLASGQQVAISVTAGKTYYIGLRSLNGDDVIVTINGQRVTYSLDLNGDGDKTDEGETFNTIRHTADLYYEAVPVDGKIVIKNNSGTDSGAILSVTKLRTSGTTASTTNTTNGVVATSSEEMLAFVQNLAELPVTEYSGDVMTEDEAIAEEPVAEETETMLDESEITIENEAEEETTPAEPSAWSRLLSSFFGFFHP